MDALSMSYWCLIEKVRLFGTLYIICISILVKGSEEGVGASINDIKEPSINDCLKYYRSLRLLFY